MDVVSAKGGVTIEGNEDVKFKICQGVSFGRLRKLKHVIKSKSGLIEINDPNFYVKFMASPLLNASTQTFYPYSSGRPS